MTPHDAPGPPAAAGEDDLLRTGDRVAELLDDLRAMVGPTAWQRVEELVQRLLELYGAGLERLLRHAAAVEREEGALATRLRGDELVASLLLLHGLHPAPTDERVRRALRELSARLGHDLELVALEPDGAARLRVRAEATGCAGSVAARAIERFVLDAAPEVTRVVVEGLAEEPAPGRERLVQLSPPRVREAT